MNYGFNRRRMTLITWINRRLKMDTTQVLFIVVVILAAMTEAAAAAGTDRDERGKFSSLVFCFIIRFYSPRRAEYHHHHQCS